MEESERNLSDCEARLQSIRQQCLSMDSIYESLKIFDKLYEKMSDYEKKNFVRTFIERIELYEDKTRHNGNPIKAVHFKFPVAYNGETVYEIVPPNSTYVETVVCLRKNFSKPKDYIQIGIDAEDYYRIKESEKKSG